MAWVFGAQGVGLGSQCYTVDRTLDLGAHWQSVLQGIGANSPGLPRIDDYGGPIAAPAPLVAYFPGLYPACDPFATSITAARDGGRSFTHYTVNRAGEKRCKTGLFLSGQLAVLAACTRYGAVHGAFRSETRD